jgi:NADH:ubiquinone oxidoreductase subunit H
MSILEGLEIVTSLNAPAGAVVLPQAMIFAIPWAPKVRVDRVMDMCWKIFIPWTLINIVLAGFAILWRVG